MINPFAGGGNFPLPKLNMGVGIYWQASGGMAPDPSGMPSYRSSVVQDPSGSLILVELVCDQNIANDQWPCVSFGPVNGTRGSSTLKMYQVDPFAPTANYGEETYKSHGRRFNYLFHDAHVETLRFEQTIGVGSTNVPRGMWTVYPND